MSIANVRANSEYQEAIRATEDFDSPAVGFARTSDYSSGVAAQNKALIKQNNTLLYLLAKQSQRFAELEEKFEQLRVRIEAKRESPPTVLEESITNLARRLDQASISGKAPIQGKKGPFYVYKNPNTIFKDEYSKASK